MQVWCGSPAVLIVWPVSSRAQAGTQVSCSQVGPPGRVLIKCQDFDENSSSFYLERLYDISVPICEPQVKLVIGVIEV